MRIIIIKILVMLLCWGRPYLLEELASWSAGKLASNNKTRFGPKLKSEIDRAIKARRG